VAILWGTQHLFIKDAVDHYPSPSLVNFSRFLLSSLFFAPGAYSAILTRDIALTEAGAELGFYSFLGFAFQAIGLQTTSPSRSAFLLYLNVKFVPLFAALLYGRKISGRIWASALTALIGTYFLSTDGGLNTVGDLWCVAAAAASAMFILKLGTHSNSFEPAKLTGISSVTGIIITIIA
jgi:drug/metabolite transporter (DMT)-like permease